MVGDNLHEWSRSITPFRLTSQFSGHRHGAERRQTHIQPIGAPCAYERPFEYDWRSPEGRFVPGFGR